MMRGLPVDVAERLAADLVVRGQDPARFLDDPYAAPVLAEADDVSAAVVLAGFAIDAYLDGLVRMLRGLSASEVAAWHRAFTRTVYLAGNPRKLHERHPADVIDSSGAIAFYRPKRRRALEPLSRLLTTFAVRAPGEPLLEGAARGDREGVSLEVELDARGMPAAELLVHLGHSVAEPFVTGEWSGEGSVTLRSAPMPLRVPAGCAHLRVTRGGDGAMRWVGWSRVIGGSR